MEDSKGIFLFVFAVPSLVMSLQATSIIAAIPSEDEIFLNCSVELPSSVNSSDVALNFEWSGPSGQVVESENVSIHNTTQVGKLYTSGLTLHELDIEGISGDYYCTVEVMSLKPYVQGSSDTAVKTITQGRRYRGGRGGLGPPTFKGRGLSPPTFADKNGAPPPVLPVRGIPVLTVSDIAYIHNIIAQY